MLESRSHQFGFPYPRFAALDRKGSIFLDGEPQRRLLDFGAAHDVPVIDVLPALRAAGGTDLYLRQGAIRFDPVHFSPRGHSDRR